MTNKLYYFDTYKMKHEATVVALHPETNAVELDGTIFHPQGGGQPSDKGTIGGIPVIKVLDTAEGGVQHYLASPPPFSVGSVVDLEVDPIARLIYAKLHSAGHAIAHLGERIAPGLKAVQGHHFPGEARIEFVFTDLPNPAEFVADLTAALQAVIHGKAQVQVDCGEAGRKITMGDFPITPCGGTHVKDLSEIEGVTIRSAKKNKDRLRVGYGFGSY